jgi:hypothetical protein
MEAPRYRPFEIGGRPPLFRSAIGNTARKGRGGRRLGAGRKPNLKQLVLQPITAAEIIARRHPLSERLSPEELAMLHALTKKLAEPSPDASRN